MIVDLAARLVAGLADVARAAGPVGLVLAGLLCAVVWLAVTAADRTLRLLGRVTSGWRRLPLGVQQLLGAVVAWFVVWPWLRDHLNGQVVAGAVGWYLAYWIGAQYLRRPDEGGLSNWQVWRRWGIALARTRAHDGAARAALGKEAAPRVVAAPVLVGEVEVVTYQPPDGMSPQALAERIEAHELDSAATRRADGVRRAVSAHIEPDGTVRAEYDTKPAEEARVDLGSIVVHAPRIEGP